MDGVAAVTMAAEPEVQKTARAAGRAAAMQGTPDFQESRQEHKRLKSSPGNRDEDGKHKESENRHVKHGCKKAGNTTFFLKSSFTNHPLVVAG